MYILFQFLLINIVILFFVNNIFVSAEYTESQRALILKKALHIRYGLEGEKSDPYTSIPLFEELSDGYKDKIAIESLYQLGNIYLLGYRKMGFLTFDIPKATEYFSNSAKMGHPISQYLMAFLHSYDITNGPGLNKDMALMFLNDSVKNKFTPALLALAYHHMYNSSFPNVKYAIDLYKQVLTDDVSLYSKIIYSFDDLKISYQNVEKYKQAYNEFLKERELELKNDLNSKNLNKCSEGGSGSCKDCSEPSNETVDQIQNLMKEYENSPENVVPYLIELALMFINGIDVPINYENAIKLLEKATKMGSSDAANVLGNIFMFGLEKPQEGKPIPINRKLALKFFKIAASDHNAESLYFLGEMVSAEALSRGKFFGDQLESSYQLYRMSADYGYPAAYLRCAQMLEEGHGVEQDLDKAALNYKTLAEHFYNNGHYDRTFHSLMEGENYQALVYSYLSAFSGTQVGQWNASMLLLRNDHGVFDKNDLKTHLSNSLIQGNTDTLYWLGGIALKEGKNAVSQELYQIGFNSGSIECINPLVKLYSKTNLKRAIKLLQYKNYRNSIGLNNGRVGLISSYFDRVNNAKNIAILKIKRMLYNVFK